MVTALYLPWLLPIRATAAAGRIPGRSSKGGLDHRDGAVRPVARELLEPALLAHVGAAISRPGSMSSESASTPILPDQPQQGGAFGVAFPSVANFHRASLSGWPTEDCRIHTANRRRVSTDGRRRAAVRNNG